MSESDRRTFLRRGAMGAGALRMVSLQELMSRRVYGAVLAPSPYGPLSPKLDETTGLALLQLPDGFKYWSYSWTGDPLEGGILCPNLHDGMAVVEGDPLTRRLILVRNHEGGSGDPYIGRQAITFAGDTRSDICDHGTLGIWSALTKERKDARGRSRLRIVPRVPTRLILG